MNSDLSGKVCVITGAAGVLCSRMVFALCEAGAHVALVGRTLSKLEALAAELKEAGYENCIAVAADVCNRTALELAHREINASLGSIDILVNGAGGNNPKATTAMEYMNENVQMNKTEQIFLTISLSIKNL